MVRTLSYHSYNFTIPQTNEITRTVESASRLAGRSIVEMMRCLKLRPQLLSPLNETCYTCSL